jgi:hypothetical protein
MKTIVYTFRGRVERPYRRGYEWHEAYSETSADGNPLYPWLTKAEARADAKRQGGRATFQTEEDQ